MITPANAKDHPPAGQDIGGGVVFGQSQWVPHGVDVEPAAKLQILGQVGHMNVHHQKVGDALVTFMLEVVFGRPECVVTQFFHLEDDCFGFVEHSSQGRVG